ncbi:hypothetical protein N5J06_15490 [Ralstonia sp. CHL-2022]|uniref:Type III effector protein n=1 Tax=Ralstonia mojiangensis TaxID=2953895 RepID=A0ABT2LCL5_9RALS|nr:hypothetical protein [Ralstonia mojiangensis]MCT7312369.1 hypothetical protein [Ralstonia mojiangensis]
MAQGSSLQDAVHATQASNPLATAEQMAMAAIAAQAAQQAQQSARANTKPKQPTDLIDRATRQVADAHVLDAKVVDQAGQLLKRPVQSATGKPDLTRLHAPDAALVDRMRAQMQAGATPAEAVNVLRAEQAMQQPDADLDLAVAALMACAAEHGGPVANALPLAMRDLGATFPAATLTLAFSQADIAASTQDCNQAVTDYRAAESSGAPADEQDSKLTRANAALTRLQRAMINGMRCVADNAPDGTAAAGLVDAFGRACVAAATPELRQQLSDTCHQAMQAVLAEAPATRHSTMALYLLGVDQSAAADVSARAADAYVVLAQKHQQAAQASVDSAQAVLDSNRNLPASLRRAEAPSDNAAFNQAQHQLTQANAEVADAQAQQQATAAGKDVVLPAKTPELSGYAASLADLQRATSGALADFKRALGNEVAQDATQAYANDAQTTLQAAQRAAQPSHAVPAGLRRAEEQDNLGSLHDAKRTARDAQAQQKAAAANKPTQVPQTEWDQGVAAAQRAHAGQGLDEAIARASLSGQVEGAAAPLTPSTPGLTAFEQTLAGSDAVTLGLVRTSQFDLTQVQKLPAAERMWLLGSLPSADAAFMDPRRTQQVAGRLQQLAILKLAGVTLDWNDPAVQRDPFPWAAQHATPEQKQIMGRWVAAADDARVLWVQEHCNAQAPAGDPRDPSHIGAVQNAMQIAAINRNNALTPAAAGVIDQMTASTFGPAFWSDQIGQLLKPSERDTGLQTIGLVRVGQFMKQLAPYMSGADASRALDWIKANYKEDWFDNNPEALSDAGSWYEGVAALVQAALPEKNRGAEFATWLIGPQSTLARSENTTRDTLLASAQQMGANGDQQLPEALRAALKPVDPDAALRLDDYYQGGLQSFVAGKGYLSRDDRTSYSKTQWAAYQALPEHAAEGQVETLVARVSGTPYTAGSVAFHNALGLSLGMADIGTSTDAQARANRAEQWLNTPNAPVDATTEWFAGDRLADAGNVIGAFDSAIASGIQAANAKARRSRAPEEHWSLTVMPMRAYGEQSGQMQMALVRVQGDQGTTFYVGSRGGGADDPTATATSRDDFLSQTALTTKDCLVMPKGGNVARSSADGTIAMETVAGHINSTLDDINDATGIPMLVGGVALGVVAALSTGPVGLAAELLIALPTATLGLANLANMAGHDRSLTSGEAIGAELMVAAAGGAAVARTLDWGASLPEAARSGAEVSEAAGNSLAVGRSAAEAISSEASGVRAAGAVDGVAEAVTTADVRPALAQAAQRLRAVSGVAGGLQAALGLQQLAAVWDDPEQRDHELFMQVMNFAAMVGMAPLMGGVRAVRERRAMADAGRPTSHIARTSDSLLSEHSLQIHAFVPEEAILDLPAKLPPIARWNRIQAWWNHSGTQKVLMMRYPQLSEAAEAGGFIVLHDDSPRQLPEGAVVPADPETGLPAGYATFHHANGLRGLFLGKRGVAWEVFGGSEEGDSSPQSAQESSENATYTAGIRFEDSRSRPVGSTTAQQRLEAVRTALNAAAAQAGVSALAEHIDTVQLHDGATGIHVQPDGQCVLQINALAAAVAEPEALLNTLTEGIQVAMDVGRRREPGTASPHSSMAEQIPLTEPAVTVGMRQRLTPSRADGEPISPAELERNLTAPASDDFPPRNPDGSLAAPTQEWRSWFAPVPPRGWPVAQHDHRHFIGVGNALDAGVRGFVAHEADFPPRLTALVQKGLFRKAGLLHDATRDRTAGTPPFIGKTLEDFDHLSAVVGLDPFEQTVAKITDAATAHSPAEKAVSPTWHEQLEAAHADGTLTMEEASGLFTVCKIMGMVDQMETLCTTRSAEELYDRLAGLRAEFGEGGVPGMDLIEDEQMAPAEVAKVLGSGFYRMVGDANWVAPYDAIEADLRAKGVIDQVSPMPDKETLLDWVPTTGSGWRAMMVANDAMKAALEADATLTHAQVAAIGAHAIDAHLIERAAQRDLNQLPDEARDLVRELSEPTADPNAPEHVAKQVRLAQLLADENVLTPDHSPSDDRPILPALEPSIPPPDNAPARPEPPEARPAHSLAPEQLQSAQDWIDAMDEDDGLRRSLSLLLEQAQLPASARATDADVVGLIEDALASRAWYERARAERKASQPHPIETVGNLQDVANTANEIRTNTTIDVLPLEYTLRPASGDAPVTMELIAGGAELEDPEALAEQLAAQINDLEGGLSGGRLRLVMQNDAQLGDIVEALYLTLERLGVEVVDSDAPTLPDGRHAMELIGEVPPEDGPPSPDGGPDDDPGPPDGPQVGPAPTRPPLPSGGGGAQPESTEPPPSAPTPAAEPTVPELEGPSDITRPQLEVLDGARARLNDAIAQLSRLLPGAQTAEPVTIDAAALQSVRDALTIGEAQGADHPEVRELSGRVEGMQLALEDAKGASSQLGEYYVTALLDRASQARAELDQPAGVATPALPAAVEVPPVDDSSNGVRDDAGDTPRALPPASGPESGATPASGDGGTRGGVMQKLRHVQGRIVETARDLVERALTSGSAPGQSVMRREQLDSAEGKKAISAGDDSGPRALSDKPGLPGVIETIQRVEAELAEMESSGKNWLAEIEEEQSYDISDDDRTQSVNTSDQIRRLAELEEAVATALEGAGQRHASEVLAIGNAFLELEAGLADAKDSRKPAALRKALDAADAALKTLLSSLSTLRERYSNLLDKLADSPIDPADLPRGVRTRDHFPRPPKPPTSS